MQKFHPVTTTVKSVYNPTVNTPVVSKEGSPGKDLLATAIFWQLFQPKLSFLPTKILSNVTNCFFGIIREMSTVATWGSRNEPGADVLINIYIFRHNLLAYCWPPYLRGNIQSLCTKGSATLWPSGILSFFFQIFGQNYFGIAQAAWHGFYNEIVPVWLVDYLLKIICTFILHLPVSQCWAWPVMAHTRGPDPYPIGYSFGRLLGRSPRGCSFNMAFLFHKKLNLLKINI